MAIDPAVIKKLLEAKPFVPFTISTTRVGTFRIDTPNCVLLTRSTLYLGNDIGEDGIPADVALIALAQVTKATPEA